MAPKKKKFTLEHIGEDIHYIRDNLIDKPPHDFRISPRFFVVAIVGAFLFGLTFALKGLLIEVTAAIDAAHAMTLFLFTIFLLSMVIYYVGYARVKNRDERGFGQFLFKRLSLYLITGIIVATILLFLYNVNSFASDTNHLISMIVALTLPCSLGASMADLLEKY